MHLLSYNTHPSIPQLGLHNDFYFLLCTTQVMAEGVPQLFRCAVVVSGILLAPQYGLMIFCTGQVSKCTPKMNHLVLSYKLIRPRYNFSSYTRYPHTQLAYSVGYVVIYYVYIFRYKVISDGDQLPVRTVVDLLPCTDPEQGHWMDPYLTQLSWSFLKQSFLKQLLTDGAFSFMLCIIIPCH